jgi:hypothetical protein
MKIFVPPEQAAYALKLGEARYANVVRNQYAGVNPNNRKDPRQDHIDGAKAEAAFALLFPYMRWLQYLEAFEGLPDFTWKRFRIDVKMIRERRHRLLLHENSPPNWLYPIGYIGDWPNVSFDHWLIGREGKLPGFWADIARRNRPCFAVPLDCTREFTEFEALVTQP